MAVPCVGHRHSGPATRPDGGGRRRLGSRRAARRAPAQERHDGRMGKGGPKAGVEGSSASPAARGRREAAVMLTGGAHWRGA
jgi:hypothetical protein